MGSDPEQKSTEEEGSPLDPEGPDEDPSPPFFKSWKGAYIFVIAFLLLLIVLFYLFTIAYS